MLNFLLVVLWAFALPYPRFRPMASCLATVWTCIIIVCKMLYQLKVVSPHEYASNCTEVRPLLQLGWRDGCEGLSLGPGLPAEDPLSRSRHLGSEMCPDPADFLTEVQVLA